MMHDREAESLSPFEQLRSALTDGLAHARGELTLRTTTLPGPAPRLSGVRVARIRKQAKMSQAVFASYLNVPTRTVQSWEQGLRTPKAGEARLLQIAEAMPDDFRSLAAVFARRTSRVPAKIKAPTRRAGRRE